MHLSLSPFLYDPFSTAALPLSLRKASGFPCSATDYVCGYAAGEAEPPTRKQVSGKPEAFRKESGKPPNLQCNATQIITPIVLPDRFSNGDTVITQDVSLRRQSNSLRTYS